MCRQHKNPTTTPTMSKECKASKSVDNSWNSQNSQHVEDSEKTKDPKDSRILAMLRLLKLLRQHEPSYNSKVSWSSWNSKHVVNDCMPQRCWSSQNSETRTQLKTSHKLFEAVGFLECSVRDPRSRVD